MHQGGNCKVTEVIGIDKKLINSLFDQAVVNPRLRINYDLRNSETDGSQRMLNAMMPGTSVPIHRHQNSSESIMIVCGSVDEVFYDDNGTEIERSRYRNDTTSDLKKAVEYLIGNEINSGNTDKLTV